MIPQACKPLPLLWLIAMVAMGLSFCTVWPRLRGLPCPFSKATTTDFSTIITMASSSPPPSSSSSSWATIWLHGLGDNGPNNAHIQHSFSFPNMKWHFPSAPPQRVTCNYGAVMPAWFDIKEIPITAESPNDEKGLLVAVRKVHKMLDKEVEGGISADKIFLCGFSQGGALTLASALLYPKRLAGAAVFSGWVPFSPTFLERVTEGKQTPLLWLHGMDDPVVNFEAGQAGPPLLASHGINCEFKAYPGLQHSISAKELTCLDQWIKAQITS